MKLLCEASYEISPSADGGPNLYIEGIFIQPDEINGNDRLYPDVVVAPAVECYDREWIQPGSAVGELDHPESPTVNYKCASHRITSLKKEGGKDYIGKALILDTYHGNEVKGLIKGGVRLAVSTRGLANVVEEGNITVVQPGLIYTTVDIVSRPSASRAFVKGLMEGKEWICESGIFKCKDIDAMRKEIKEEVKKPMMTIEGFQKFMHKLATDKY